MNRHLLFVDAHVRHIPFLFAHVRENVATAVLRPEVPAFSQIAQALAAHRNIDVLHIITHGVPGEIGFSAGPLSLESLEASADDLAAIGRALGRDGEGEGNGRHSGKDPRGGR